jgi:AcrR family transcriptional regulator
VLAAAVGLADDAGLAAVSMRKLADQLGVVPMALYKHVADKDELVDGMVDVVIGEFAPADPTLNWKDAIRHRFLSARQAVLRHGWARQAIESRTRRSPVVLAYMDSVVGMFRAGGFSVDLTHHLMHALGNRIWGFSPELFDETQRQTETPVVDAARQAELMQEAATKYPHILEVVMEATGGDASRYGCDEDFEFVFALDLLLDGAERLRDAGWRSPPRSVAGLV